MALGVLSGVPAFAATPNVQLALDDIAVAVSVPEQEATVDLRNLADTPQRLTNITITVDATGLGGKGTVAAKNDGCTTSGAVVSCTVPSFEVSYSWGSAVLRYVVRPTRAAAIGDRGTVKVAVKADGMPVQTATAQVRFVEAVDLAGLPLDRRTAAPGRAATFPLVVRNNGRTVAKGAVLAHSRSTNNVTYKREFTNCLYTDDEMACVFTEQLAAGREYKLSKPVTTDVRADAPAPVRYSTVFQWAAPDDEATWLERFRRVAKPGTGEALRLIEVPNDVRGLDQTDVSRLNNFVTVEVALTGDNTADQIAVGGTARAAVGSTVIAKVGVGNAGPARADYTRDGLFKLPGIHIVVPSNATIVSLPPGACAAAKNGERDPGRTDPVGAREVLCWSVARAIEVGETETWDVGLRVDAATGTAGSVSVAKGSVEGERVLDRDPSNNRSVLDAGLPEAGTGGGGGGLAVTGDRPGLYFGAGVLLVALGAGVYVAARRRRTRFTV